MAQSCTLCPRNCQADREKTLGYCRVPGKILAAKAMIHVGEEPCLIGKKEYEQGGGRFGAGAVFFSGCNLRCVFCQNAPISQDSFGKEISEERLGEILLELQEAGANCIDLVTPTPYADRISRVLRKIKLEEKKLTIPVVYNCGGYESVETLKLLEGLVDIYLPDLKYYDSALSLRYSKASDYFERAMEAIQEMVRQVGIAKIDEDGQMQKGVLIRHLVLPGCSKDSVKLMKILGETFSKGEIRISLMRQYTPYFGVAKDYPEINRRITSLEYERVVDAALEAGLDGYRQEKSAATMELLPKFDLSGL